MQQKWLKVVLKLLNSKINHQEHKLKEHQDKQEKEVEEAAKEEAVAEEEIEVEILITEEVVKEVDVVVKEGEEVAKEEAVAEVEIEVEIEMKILVAIEVVIEVLKEVEEAVVDQELLLMLMMKETKFLKKFIERDNPIKKILMPLITVMKKDQELAEAAEVKKKMVTEKAIGETDQRDNIKRRVLMLKQNQRQKSLKLPQLNNQFKLKKSQKKLSSRKSSVYLLRTISRTRLSSVVKLQERLKVSRVPKLLKMTSKKSSLKPNLLQSQRSSLLLLLMEKVKPSSDSQELKMKLKLEEVEEVEEAVVVALEAVLMLVQ